MPQRLRLIAAKGQHNGAFRIWYAAADNDQAPFVLTLTPQHVAQALHKPLPVTLEEIEQYADKTRDRLEVIRVTVQAGRPPLVLVRWRAPGRHEEQGPVVRSHRDRAAAGTSEIHPLQGQ